jgi:hypothetical protein
LIAQRVVLAGRQPPVRVLGPAGLAGGVVSLGA